MKYDPKNDTNVGRFYIMTRIDNRFDLWSYIAFIGRAPVLRTDGTVLDAEAFMMKDAIRYMNMVAQNCEARNLVATVHLIECQSDRIIPADMRQTIGLSA